MNPDFYIERENFDNNTYCSITPSPLLSTPSTNQLKPNELFDENQKNKNFQEADQKIEDISTATSTSFFSQQNRKQSTPLFEKNENSDSDSSLDRYIIHEKDEIANKTQESKPKLEKEIPIKNKTKEPKFALVEETSIKKKNRVDYLLKKNKTYSSQEMTNHGNNLIKNCFENKEYPHLRKPSSKEYSSILNIKQNQIWLNMKIEDIFCLGKENGSLQKSNSKVIKEIKELFNKPELSEKIEKLKNFLEMSLEDFYVHIFYKSDRFKKFCNDRDVLDWDKEFKKQNNYSLREKNALIKYFRNS